MTLPAMRPQRRPRTPRAVLLIRVLVVVQVLVALGCTALLGFVVLLALAWRTDGRTDQTAAVAGLIALLIVMASLTGILGTCGVRLRRGAEKVRLTLVAVESVLLAGVLLLTDAVDLRLRIGSVPTPQIVLGGTAVGVLVAAFLTSTRHFTAGRR